MKKLTGKTILEHGKALANKEYSSEELTRAYLEKIKETDGDVCAYITADEKGAIESARKIDKKIAADEPISPLTGIPCGIKDNICTKGIITSCASKMLADFAPPFDATVTARLKAAGMVMLGKMNMDEFAMGSTGESSAMKITRNPRDLTCSPGGSSSGSAAAVAADEAVYTLGSDTGGSIRQPAAFCGVVGMKPTYGRVSRHGLIALGSSFDQIGPITKTVTDNAAVLSVIAGHDPLDATCAKMPSCDFTAGIDGGVKGLKIGILRNAFGDRISADIKNTAMAAAETYAKLGAELVDVSMSYFDYCLAVYFVLSYAEASSNMSKFDGIGFGYRTANFNDVEELYLRTRSEAFGDEVKRRILFGNFTLLADNIEEYYQKALRVRTLIIRDFAKIFEKCDIILTPVTPTVAYKIGHEFANPNDAYTQELNNVPANVAGLPAISLPCGTGEGGLPVGLQLIGKAYSEQLIYRTAYALEKEVKL